MASTYPVIIFCFKRQDHLKQTIDCLKENYLAPDTDLYIFSDAARRLDETADVSDVRNYLRTVTGFKSVTIKEAVENKGLAKSIISGVTEVLEQHDAAIVLEDDLLTSKNFLNFMNQSLVHYQNNLKVFSVAGYTFPIRKPKDFQHDNYFTMRGSSWGWATWRNRWETVDWEVSDWKEFSNDKGAQREFNRMGSDLSGMLAKQMDGKISSWAIRWCYHQFKTSTYTVFPTVSKIQNIGFGSAATHTSAVMQSRFATVLDNSGKTDFNFNDKVSLQPDLIKQFINRYSILTRLKYKAMGYIFK
ncbi:sugar transferase [Desertivirga arenae]|uniref:sugar transferase n=1 Tax=Desertivirga arenae TaxID=2810309 RepID=UPI001A966DAA|nr:sugar transferase [Pedobacter sp. SYSU D00823]